MAHINDRPPSPSDLRETIEKAENEDGTIQQGIRDRAAYHYCTHLRRHGHSNDDYTWGFRVYRTTYSQPNSDEEFRRATGILREHLRDRCFPHRDSSLEDEKRGDVDNDPAEDSVAVDDSPNQQLWQRLRLETVEDHSNGVKAVDFPRHRFYIVVDDEVMHSLLNHPSPAVDFDDHSPNGVKVFDAAYGKPDFYYGVEADSDKCGDDDHEGEDEHAVSEEKDPAYEGWYWTALKDLPELYFESEGKGEGAMYTWHEGKPMFTAPGFVFGNNGCGHELCDEIHGSMMMALMMYANHKANREAGAAVEESER